MESMALEFDRPDPSGGPRLRFSIVPDFFSDSPSPATRGTFSAAEVVATLATIREFWEIYLDLGFTTFGVQDAGRRKFVAVFDAEYGSNGRGSDREIKIGLGFYRAVVAATVPAEAFRLTALHRALIAHELFHGVTYAVRDPFEPMVTFTEGAADAAKYLLLTDEERAVTGLATYAEYLAAPGDSMWDRPSPGLVVSGNSRSSGTLFWLYFVDQIGTRVAEPGPKMDALVHMLRSSGWHYDTRLIPDAITHRIAGRFLGNGQTQLFAESEGAVRRFSLISPSQSFGGCGQVHLTLADGSRFGDGWRVRPGDRVVAAGDVVGNGREQVVLRSGDSAYLGVVGFGHTDGQWGTASTTTNAVASVGGRWSGWKLRAEDQVQAVGNFATGSRQHMLLTSSRDSSAHAHIGVIGLTAEGAKETVAALPEGSTFGPGGWRYSASDVIAGHGPILGNGRDQVVLQPAGLDAVAVVGFDDSGGAQTYAVVGLTQRFGSGWRVNAGDRVVAVARLGDPERAQIVLASRSGNLGVVSVAVDGTTATGPVIAIGQPFGSDGWVWGATDRIVAVGSFLPDQRQQLVVGRSRTVGPLGPGGLFGAASPPLVDLAIVNLDAAGGFATYDTTIDTIDPVERIWAVGDFAGIGTDQLLGSRGRYLLSMSVEQPRVDTGFWRESRFKLIETGTFHSTLRMLEQHAQAMRDDRTFLEIWRDFTITNLTKDLAHGVKELRYSIPVDPDPANPVAVATNPYPTAATTYRVNKWAATYLDLTAPAAGTWRLTGRVADSPFEAFWSVVVADARGTLRAVTKRRGNSLDTFVSMSPGDTTTLIVTSTFADLDIEIDPPTPLDPPTPDLPTR